MKKPNISKILSSIRTSAAKHSPEILTGIGIAGMITTTVLAVRATPKALRLIDDEKDRINQQLFDEAKAKGYEEFARMDRLNPVEIVKTTWTCYLPAVITGGVSVACLIGANSVNVRRNAALATAYTLSESALKEYQEKVVETIGEKKEQSVRDAIAKDKLEQNPVTNREVIITDKGDTLCFDVPSGRYFKSDIEKLKKAVNELNRRMRDEMYISLNEFYYEIGLNGIGIGDDLGWNIDNGYIEPSFSSQLAEDGTPCLVLGYHVEPRYDYRTA